MYVLLQSTPYTKLLLNRHVCKHGLIRRCLLLIMMVVYDLCALCVEYQIPLQTHAELVFLLDVAFSTFQMLLSNTCVYVLKEFILK